MKVAANSGYSACREWNGGFFLKRYRFINKVKNLDPARTAKDPTGGYDIIHITKDQA